MQTCRQVGLGWVNVLGARRAPSNYTHSVPKAIIHLFQPLLSRVEPISVPPKHSPFLDLLTILPSKTAHWAD